MASCAAAMAIDTTPDVDAPYQGVIAPDPNYGSELQESLGLVPQEVEDIKEQSAESAPDLEVNSMDFSN